MNERIRSRLAFLKSGEYKKTRRELKREVVFADDVSHSRIQAELLSYFLKNETPILFGDDRIGFNRVLSSTPYATVNGERLPRGIGNVTPNYAYALSSGMDAIVTRIEGKLAECREDQRDFYESALACLESVLAFADRYRDYAKDVGATELYTALCQVPHKPPRSFHEACVFMKFLQYTLRACATEHVTLGGFDKYMYPYFESDIARGVGEDELFEMLEEFFISLNFDTDLYIGVQQGDNGQSMVLGGRDTEGTDRYNKLSEMCIKASTELCIIDPKINLRVDKDTPIERLELATQLTKKGLGFPQYCNDDVVIPGLVKWGYSHEDACDYTVAACWEYISSGKGADIPNLDRMNFPMYVARAVNEGLSDCNDFDEFLRRVEQTVRQGCRIVAERMQENGKKYGKAPYLSIFVDDCIERGLDMLDGGAVYNNYGAHGVGISNAADAIAAVKRAVFEDEKCTACELTAAIASNFEGYTELRNYLLSCPKMGNNDDYVDCYADMLMRIYEEEFRAYRNHKGGIFRPGTGSAMEYLWSSRYVGATADGRLAGTPFGSSFSPSISARINGPLSCIQSFTKHDMSDIINGGPLTMEIHENTFRNDDGVKKVAALVKAFIDLGGHQLQLNSINRDVLLDAQKHPEDHKNLIVRVWGWSGYFNELDVEYQNHIISRTEFAV